MFNLSTPGVAASFAAALYLAPLPFLARAAEKTVVPKFKNVDEGIGWVKAKGKCEILNNNPQQQLCTLRVELSEEKKPEIRGESVWQRWAVMQTPTLERDRGLTVYLVRSRKFSLSANDKKADVRSVKTATYHFGKDGKCSQVSVGFVLENFKALAVRLASASRCRRTG